MYYTTFTIVNSDLLYVGWCVFIDKLNDGEKQILINLMMLLVKADNRLSNREASHMLAISKKYDLIMNFNLDKKVKDVCADIKCEQSKIIIIQELVWAAIKRQLTCPVGDN